TPTPSRSSARHSACRNSRWAWTTSASRGRAPTSTGTTGSTPPRSPAPPWSCWAADPSGSEVRAQGARRTRYNPTTMQAGLAAHRSGMRVLHLVELGHPLIAPGSRTPGGMRGGVRDGAGAHLVAGHLLIAPGSRDSGGMRGGVRDGAGAHLVAGHLLIAPGSRDSGGMRGGVRDGAGAHLVAGHPLIAPGSRTPLQ